VVTLLERWNAVLLTLVYPKGTLNAPAFLMKKVFSMICRALLFAFALAFLCGSVKSDDTPAPMPAEEVARGMQLPEGFQATVFAAEPDVVQPMAITLDDRGRLWVVECFSYPNWQKEEGPGKDRVSIF
jgi:hypothetical protein